VTFTAAPTANRTISRPDDQQVTARVLMAMRAVLLSCLPAYSAVPGEVPCWRDRLEMCWVAAPPMRAGPAALAFLWVMAHVVNFVSRWHGAVGEFVSGDVGADSSLFPASAPDVPVAGWPHGTGPGPAGVRAAGLVYPGCQAVGNRGSFPLFTHGVTIPNAVPGLDGAQESPPPRTGAS
jgi:hypothetical protein